MENEMRLAKGSNCRPDVREIVINGDHLYELMATTNWSLATVGALRLVAEHDLQDARDEPIGRLRAV
jgi:hypothetical protein